ncbi:MAG: LysE family translocator [Pontibacterium sp.]
MQGFITAIANPKGWAFMISLLPPFIDENQPLLLQLAVLVSIIMFFEFVCMSIYATGGKSLKHLLGRSENVRTMNKVSGLLIMGVSIWLWLS